MGGVGRFGMAMKMKRMKKVVLKMTKKTYKGVSRQGGAGIHGVLGRHGAGLGGIEFRIVPHSWC